MCRYIAAHKYRAALSGFALPCHLAEQTPEILFDSGLVRIFSPMQNFYILEEKMKLLRRIGGG